MSSENVPVRSSACISCRKPLESAISDRPGEFPYGGLIFTSHGNYGSTLYDLEGDRFLQVVICDECVEVAARDGLVEQGHPQMAPDPTYTVWSPDPDPAEGLSETEYLLSSPANAEQLQASIAQLRPPEA